MIIKLQTNYSRKFIIVIEALEVFQSEEIKKDLKMHYSFKLILFNSLPTEFTVDEYFSYQLRDLKLTEISIPDRYSVKDCQVVSPSKKAVPVFLQCYSTLGGVKVIVFNR